VLRHTVYLHTFYLHRNSHFFTFTGQVAICPTRNYFDAHTSTQKKKKKKKEPAVKLESHHRQELSSKLEKEKKKGKKKGGTFRTRSQSFIAHTVARIVNSSSDNIDQNKKFGAFVAENSNAE
jgi:hypothetical protein